MAMLLMWLDVWVVSFREEGFGSRLSTVDLDVGA